MRQALPHMGAGTGTQATITEDTMGRKPQVTPNAKSAPTEAEMAAADKVRAERAAKRAAKAAADEAKAAVKKPGMTRPDSRKNVFGIAASASKVTAVSRSIISRSRGGRGR